MAAESNATLVGEREIRIARVLDAPRELVWQAWTDPAHVGEWWGPEGFRTTTEHMDVRPGGLWRFIMHGPDGRDYPNLITFLEVKPPERLVYSHGGDKDVEPVNFETTVTFTADNGRTRLDMRMLFPSAAARAFAVDTYGAVDGLTQTIGRLAAYLPRLRRS